MAQDSPGTDPRGRETHPDPGRVQRSGERPESLGELLAERAAMFPSRVAFEMLDGPEGRTAWTYGQLHERAGRIAAALAGELSPGDRAVLLYPPGLEFVEAFFGCIWAGVLPVPTSYPKARRPMPRLMGIARDCSPAAVLTTHQTLEQTDPACREAAPRWIVTDALPPGDAVEPHRPKRTDLAFLQYTSGSTSDPRGVMITHDNLLANLEAIRTRFCLEEADPERPAPRGVFWLPAFHDMGLVGAILTPIHVGATSHLMSPATFLRRPLEWLEEISRTGAEISGGPNFAFRLCAEKAADLATPLDLSRWRLAFCGAEPIDAGVLDTFAEALAPHGFKPDAFFPCYGLAEATLLAAGDLGPHRPCVLHVDRRRLEGRVVEPVGADEPDALPLVACGGAPEGHELRIVDPQTRLPVEDEKIGEIWVRGGSVAVGYWGHDDTNPDVFAATLASDPDNTSGGYLRTGDLGFLRDGRLFVVGRIKDVIIVRGRNHFPQDIEQTAQAAHEAVDEGAAFSIDSPEGEELVVVHQVARTFRNENLGCVAERVRAEIADRHEIDPLAVLLIRPASLPTTSSGKVQRSRCRELYLAGDLPQLATWRRPENGELGRPVARPDFSKQLQSRDREALADEIQRWLVRWLPARAGIAEEEVDPATSFADLGIDSLTAVEMTVELDEATGLQLPPLASLEYPTPAELSRHLADEMLTAHAVEARTMEAK